MPLEKNHSAECFRMLSVFGWATKMVQDTMVCDHCHRPMHPFHVGWADYTADIRTIDGPASVKVECKGGRDRFNHEQIKAEQLEWLRNWEDRTGGVSWIWLQLGDEKVDTANAMARRVWLIDLSWFTSTMMLTQEKTGLKYTPLSPEVIELNNMRFKETGYAASNIFKRYELEWLGKKLWRPNVYHPFWHLGLGKRTIVNYDEFTSAAERSE